MTSPYKHPRHPPPQSAVLTWEDRVEGYRQEPVVRKVLDLLEKKSLSIDLSCIKECHGYLPFLREKDSAVRQINGPDDFDRIIDLVNELNVLKDRVSSILLRYRDVKSRLERGRDLVRHHITLKREVISALKNENQRVALLGQIMPEMEDRICECDRVIGAADTVYKSLNQTYNLLKIQVEAMSQMFYQAGLSNVENKLNKKLQR